jgi:clan AA aspartic protease
VFAEIDLARGDDIALLRHGLIAEGEVKRARVRARIDTGAISLCINEEIRSRLELATVDHTPVELADGSTVELDVAGPVEIRFANRRAIVDAIVLPGRSEPLLGAIPMEAMDVLVDPLREELVVNPKHPDRAGFVA